MPPSTSQLTPIPPPSAVIIPAVHAALSEDIGSGDLTAALVPEAQQALATVITREPAVLCGRAWVDAVFAELDPAITIDWQCRDGDALAAGQTLCELRGPARAILTGERTALNFLQTLSAVASNTRRHVDAVAGTGTTILDTRKTIPGLRLAQKYAVRVGGGMNHRIGLYDAILIKENHIVAAGGITAAVRRARAQGATVLLEVEVETLEQAGEALRAGADRLLLDNFSTALMREAVTLRNRLAPGTGLEASGGIDLQTIRSVAETGIDFISVGNLTKNIRAIDLSMRFSFNEPAP
ncbi:MAG: carboxylating nicotinate-nucleotide diphosphorylase [Gammaproteobacteria bacterium]|nr:carboxylating nicotinate-nucleotide diphosphorylase [Gammaproteobacteria bacterium]